MASTGRMKSSPFAKPIANLESPKQSGMALVLVEGDFPLPNISATSANPSTPGVSGDTTMPDGSQPHATATNGGDRSFTRSGLLVALAGILFVCLRHW